jgi:hypothetical protein
MRPEILVFFIPIIAIVMTMGSGMLSMYLNFKRRKEMFALYHQQRMAAIEKGTELPPLPDDFFRDTPRLPRRSGHGSLLGGLIMLFVGLTTFVAMYFAIPREDSSGAAWFALIPAGVGAACLIYYVTVGRKQATQAEAERQARIAEIERRGNPTARV